jgi:hypothetical protein
MKAVLSSSASPTFTPGAANAGTLNFSTAVASYGFAFGRLLGIINLTQNTILYTAGVSGYGGSWASGTSILTLAQATTGNSSTDTLEVIWDDPRASIIIEAPNPSIPAGWPSKFHLVSAASTNATSVKSSSGTLGSISFFGGSGSANNGFLKVYDKASSPTVGTDTPVMTVGTYGSAGYVSNPILPAGGVKFSNGIAIAMTVGVSDTDTTSVAAASLAVTIIYA